MLTESEMKRWASLMLISSLRGSTNSETITQQVELLKITHGDDVIEKILIQILKEAIHLGPLHSNGCLYQTKVSLKTYI